MSEKIPAPTVGVLGTTEADVARWHAKMAVLDADPRTAGTANRPKWLTDRVLREAAEKTAAPATKPTLLDRAIAIPVVGRSTRDNFAAELKNTLMAQARDEHAQELAALRAEIASLRAGVAA